LRVPFGKRNLSRILGVFRDTIDREATVSYVPWRSAHRAPPLARRSTKSEIFKAGVKVIDVLMPLDRAGKAGLFGVSGAGSTVLLTERINNLVGQHEMVSIGGGIGECLCNWEELYRDMKAADVRRSMVKVFGQMNARQSAQESAFQP
jgi:F-type H+-transporting ATPase subunit beta